MLAETQRMNAVRDLASPTNDENTEKKKNSITDRLEIVEKEKKHLDAQLTIIQRKKVHFYEQWMQLSFFSHTVLLLEVMRAGRNLISC